MIAMPTPFGLFKTSSSAFENRSILLGRAMIQYTHTRIIGKASPFFIPKKSPPLLTGKYGRV
jgi:hypothetical protein